MERIVIEDKIDLAEIENDMEIRKEVMEFEEKIKIQKAMETEISGGDCEED